MRKTKLTGHRLPTQSRNSARQCLEVHYITSSGAVEDALALCTGMRAALGEDMSSVENLFEGDAIRIVYRAHDFVHPKLGIRYKAVRAISELENACLTNEGAQKLWNTLAAAVGDIEADASDRRIRDILLLLRGEIDEDGFSPKRTTRPSPQLLMETLTTVRAERMGQLEERRAIREEQMRTRRQEMLSRPQDEAVSPEADVTSPEPEAIRPPGKIALRILALMHEGNVAVQRHAYQMPGNQPDDRVTFEAPETEGGDRPTFLFELSGSPIKKHYSIDHLWDLDHAGLIARVDDYSPYVSCLTPKGIEEATKLFGPPTKPLMIRQGNGDLILSEHLDASLRKLFADGNEDAFMAEFPLVGELERMIEIISEGSSGHSAAAAASWLATRSSRPTGP